MRLDDEQCYRAVQSKDARFDGWFVTAVRTTGIYCRPSCPAITPKRGNVEFFLAAATAQQHGYRACKRCRPDATPGSPQWNTRADVVGRAMRLIADGLVDRDGVGGLARRLGYSERQINRLLVTEVGTGPLALARAQRAQTARVLIETTTMPITDVAFAAGFASVRQFNDTVRAVFASTPSELRLARRAMSGAPTASPGELTVRLAVRAPFDAAALFDFLGRRGVPGVEHVDEHGTYRRSLRLAHGAGVVALTPTPDAVTCALRLDDIADAQAAVQRCRRMLDLDSDPIAIDEQLGADPLLAELVRKRPGLRSPGHPAGDELLTRALLGQQVSVAGARTLAARLVDRCGDALTAPTGAITRLFPTAAAIAAAGPSGLAMPKALPGIGAWTAEYVLMRALGDPDVFMPTDLGVRHALTEHGADASPAASRLHAERWRPFRSYALHHLWASLGPSPVRTRS